MNIRGFASLPTAYLVFGLVALIALDTVCAITDGSVPSPLSYDCWVAFSILLVICAYAD